MTIDQSWNNRDDQADRAAEEAQAKWKAEAEYAAWEEGQQGTTHEHFFPAGTEEEQWEPQDCPCGYTFDEQQLEQAIEMAAGYAA
jgi:hypothetical protein